MILLVQNWKKYTYILFLIYLTQIQLQNASVTLVNFDLTINFSIKLNAKNIWDPILLIVLSWNPKSEIKLAIGMLWICCSRAAGVGGGQNPPTPSFGRYGNPIEIRGQFLPTTLLPPAPLDFHTALFSNGTHHHPSFPSEYIKRMKIENLRLSFTKYKVLCILYVVVEHVFFQVGALWRAATSLISSLNLHQQSSEYYVGRVGYI